MRSDWDGEEIWPLATVAKNIVATADLVQAAETPKSRKGK